MLEVKVGRLKNEMESVDEDTININELAQDCENVTDRAKSVLKHKKVKKCVLTRKRSK